MWEAALIESSNFLALIVVRLRFNPHLLLLVPPPPTETFQHAALGVAAGAAAGRTHAPIGSGKWRRNRG